jgi:hypothetical protein
MSDYQLHPDLNDELNASRAELADMSEQRDRLRQSVTLLEHRIDQQRRELARLNRLVADQRAAMAAEGIDYADAERLAGAWGEAKRWHEAWKESRAEVARLLPLALAVGACSADDVPESVYRAYAEPEGYRADEIHRLREELAVAEGRAFNLERQNRYLLERIENAKPKDRRGVASDQPDRGEAETGG